VLFAAGLRERDGDIDETEKLLARMFEVSKVIYSQVSYDDLLS
jgi:hypothetical protein